MNQRNDVNRPRGSLPRPLSEILDPALQRLATSDQARAFGAWARAAGVPVASCARPGGFFNGVLTVDCVSSIWANELTYLGSQILARMDEVAPGHPVKRLRFVVERAARSAEEAEASAPEASAARPDDRCERLTGAALEKAKAAAQGVRDQRLREAIEAALRASSGER